MISFHLISKENYICIKKIRKNKYMCFVEIHIDAKKKKKESWQWNGKHWFSGGPENRMG